MDDLLDLSWNGSSSSSNGSSSRAAPSKANNGYSAFDSLAAAGSRTPSSANYSSHAFRAASPATSAVTSPIAVSSGIRPRSPLPSQPTSAASTSDAFSSLFATAAGGSGSNASMSSNSMTMSQRLDMRRGGNVASASSTQPKKSDELWDFDMLSPSSSSSTVPRARTPSFVVSPAEPNKAHTAGKGLKTANLTDIFDPFENLNLNSDSQHSLSDKKQRNGDVTSISMKAHQKHTGHGSTQSTQDDSDDLLGLLGQPVQASTSGRKDRTNGPASTSSIVSPKPRSPLAAGFNDSSEPPLRAVAARTPSPPPHILGEVVMMGFSVQQARLALAATLGAEKPGQWSVAAAVEVLASDGAANAQRQRSPDTLQQRKQPSSRSRDQQSRQTSSRTQEDESASANGNADLLAQASTVGLSVLKSANAYWKTGKAQIQKAVEDNKFIQQQLQVRGGLGSGSRSPAGGSSGANTPTSGRPKWMTQPLSDDEDVKQLSPRRGAASSSIQPSEYQDSDSDGNDGKPPPLRKRPSPQSSPKSSRPADPRKGVSTRRETVAPKAMEAPPPSTQSGSMLDVFRTSLKSPQPIPSGYISPNRRKPQVNGSHIGAEAPSSSSISLPRDAARPARPAREAVLCSRSALAASNQSKLQGNDHFKLGRYGEAISAYDNALQALPEKYLGRIPVLNNRANARLKNGEERRAAEDGTAVIVLLMGDATLAESATKGDFSSMLSELGAASASGDDALDAHDALGKALSRRARGFEANEKWRLAMRDWQVLVELGDHRVLRSAGGIKVVSEGLARCRRVVDGPSTAKSGAPTQADRAKPKPTPKPKPAALSSVRTTAPSAAVTALRQGEQKAEKDENERIRLKDEVDARVQSWKGGKENNLRALIASLDNVLWEELQWKKVGMHELITESQLKIRYVKAIGKVHPDKIGNTATVEQRMIAGAVFAALSDAWNASR